MTTLAVLPWQRVVVHPNFEITLEEDPTPDPAGPLICSTTLPAIVCTCGRYLIEVVDNHQGPRPVGYEGVRTNSMKRTG